VKRVLIHDSDADLRQAVAFALGEINSDAAPAIPALIKALVGEIGPSANPAAAHLGKTLGSEDEDVRKTAAYTLAAIGPGARTAVPVLVKALSDHIPSIRLAAAYMPWVNSGLITPGHLRLSSAQFTTLTTTFAKKSFLRSARLAEMKTRLSMRFSKL
jgi:hypothetical protein